MTTWFVFLYMLAGVAYTSAANDSELQFITLGDWGEVLFQGQARVAQAMANWTRDNDPQMIVTLGDNFYPWGIFSVDDNQLNRKWRDVYHIYEELEQMPWYLSIGNHDYGLDNGEEWNQIWLSEIEELWNFPHLWHDFVVLSENGQTSVHVIVVDTESMRSNTNNHTLMWDWLHSTLASSTADWKIVVGHREIYSAGDKGPVNGRLYSELRPVLEQYQVDVYLCGHDHNLQHIRSKTYDEEDYSMDYIVNGAGGALWYAYDPESEAVLDEQYNMNVEFFRMTWGFVTVTASSNQLTFFFYDASGELLYEYSRHKQGQY